jgi:hypothetical protein
MVCHLLLLHPARAAVRGKIVKGFQHLKGLMAGHHSLSKVTEEGSEAGEDNEDGSVADDASLVRPCI